MTGLGLSRDSLERRQQDQKILGGFCQLDLGKLGKLELLLLGMYLINYE